MRGVFFVAIAIGCSTTQGGGPTDAMLDHDVGLDATSSGDASSEGDTSSGSGRYILRHFEVNDLVAIQQKSFDYGLFHGFVYGHVGIEETTVSALIADGKMHFRYYTILDYPPSAWDDGWFTWLRATAQVGWNARMVNTSGQVAVFRYLYDKQTCEHRELIDWSQIDASRAQAVADKMFEFAKQSVFLDQAWLEPADWMFCDAATVDTTCGPCPNGAPYSSFPASKWQQHRANLMKLYQIVDAKAASQNGWVLKNGEHETVGGDRIPRPIYYENSQVDWAKALSGWQEHARNVLSVDAPDPTYVPLMLAEFKKRGGWIAFTDTGDIAGRESAYAQAIAMVNAP